MRLSLRFVIPLLLAIGAFAYIAVLVADTLMLRWFVRDLDIRSSLIAQTVQEPLTGLVETGYTYPASLGYFDQRFSLRTSRYYVVVRNDNLVEIHRAADGYREDIASPTSNTPWYPLFVAESLDRFARGLPPLADLDDLLSAMRVVDAAYASNRAGGVKVQVDG